MIIPACGVSLTFSSDKWSLNVWLRPFTVGRKISFSCFKCWFKCKQWLIKAHFPEKKRVNPLKSSNNIIHTLKDLILRVGKDGVIAGNYSFCLKMQKMVSRNARTDNSIYLRLQILLQKNHTFRNRVQIDFKDLTRYYWSWTGESANMILCFKKQQRWWTGTFRFKPKKMFKKSIEKKRKTTKTSWESSLRKMIKAE